jgi:hypothetical protein
MENSKIEKFGLNELTNLRNELMESGLDSFQGAQVLSSFLSGRGYGIGTEQARAAVLRLDHNGFSYERMQQELERIALVM